MLIYLLFQKDWIVLEKFKYNIQGDRFPNNRQITCFCKENPNFTLLETICI